VGSERVCLISNGAFMKWLLKSRVVLVLFAVLVTLPLSAPISRAGNNNNQGGNSQGGNNQGGSGATRTAPEISSAGFAAAALLLIGGVVVLTTKRRPGRQT
jgi:hypothetical protein